MFTSDQSHIKKAKGENHHFWTGGEVTVVCEECGIDFKVEKYRLIKGVKYCSMKCKYNGSGKNISKAKKGKSTSPETCFKKGHKPSLESIRKSGAANRGRIISERIKKKCLYCNADFTIINPLDSKKCCSRHCANKWKDKGKTPEARRLRTSNKYKDWRTKVFIRDKHTCQDCGKIGGKLNADHIKRFSEYPELRFEVDNGKTLCEDCHRKTPTFGNRRAA